MLKQLIISIFIILNMVIPAASQEMNCTLTINTDRIRSSETQLFERLQQDLKEMINSKRWTQDVFKPEERIECDIQFTIKSMSGQSFKADVMVQSSRPVYGSDYSTPVFNYVDTEVPFTYQQDQPLYFTENNYTDNLTSVIAFYVYVILGFDYDSFSRNGGTPYFDKANEIVLLAQQSGDAGWTSEGSNKKDRYNLMNQLLNPQYAKMREGYYTYHRLALDNFEKDQQGARAKIKEVIESTQRMNNLDPNLPLLGVFFNAKSSEITNIFKQASIAEKQQILKILEQVDAINMDQYNKMNERR